MTDATNLEERALLDALHQQPHDDDLRRIYADWLEEHGDVRADYLHLELYLRTLRPESEELAEARQRLWWLAAKIDRDWIAAVSRGPIENCPSRPGHYLQHLRFRYQCPLRWEHLLPTDAAQVRYCTECGQGVYFCDSLATARDHARQGHCIALDPGVPRRTGDLGESQRSDDEESDDVLMGIAEFAEEVDFSEGDGAGNPP